MWLFFPLFLLSCVLIFFPGPSSFHVHCYMFSVLKILIPYGSTCFLRSHTPNTSSEGNWIHRSIRIRVVVIRVAKLPLIKLHHIISYHIPCISPLYSHYLISNCSPIIFPSFFQCFPLCSHHFPTIFPSFFHLFVGPLPSGSLVN